MKTIKAHVCKYNVKTGKKEIVIEEIPVYPEPKPVPTPEQIKIKKLESKNPKSKSCKPPSTQLYHT